MATLSKHEKIKSEPVLLFDNNASGIELLTIPETAKLLKISTTGVRRLQQSRSIPFIKVGGSIRFSRHDLLSYLVKMRVEPIAQ